MDFTDITMNIQDTVVHRLPNSYSSHKETKFPGTEAVFLYVLKYISYTLNFWQVGKTHLL